MDSKAQREDAMKAAGRTGMDPAVMASGASVLLSWYYFFVRGDRERGIFVGLWPPTILAFASYFEQTRMSNMINRSMGRETLTNRVQRIVEEVNR